MALTWYVCDVKTGAVRDELPLTAGGDIERTVGASSTVSATLAVRDPSCPANWPDLLDPRSAMIVLDDDGAPLVGYILEKPVAGGPTVTLSLRSLEAITEHVYCRTHDFFEGTDDEADVATTLLSDVLAPSFGFTVITTQTGKTADHSYAYEEDRTVGSALNDLMSADGGPEWTVRLAWSDGTRSQIVKTIQVGPQIGSVIPSTVVENKHLDSRIRTLSAAGSDLATHVIATSDGSGPDRPMSDAYVDQDAIDAGIPQWEARIPTTAIDDPDQLNRIAEAGLRRRWFGTTTWEMVLAMSEPGCPRVGRDFDAGDTITIDSDPVGMFETASGEIRYDDPAEWHGPARIIGWRGTIAGSTFRTVTPVFWEDKEVGTA